jgi:hypothetical protein
MTDDSASRGETTSLLAATQRQRLRQCLRRSDMVPFTLSALIGVDTLGQVASFGAATFTWIVILSLSFLLPYGRPSGAIAVARIKPARPKSG